MLGQLASHWEKNKSHSFHPDKFQIDEKIIMRKLHKECFWGDRNLLKPDRADCCITLNSLKVDEVGGM